jgi:hypothetical protein
MLVSTLFAQLALMSHVYLVSAQVSPPYCNNQDGGGDYPGCGIAKSTYSCNDPIAAWNFLNKYFPVRTPTDECDNNICQCPANENPWNEPWEVQQGRVYAVRPNTTDSQVGDGFGLHCVNVSRHWTTGGKSTAEVEAIFDEKLSDMSTRYDSFMDYNVIFATEGLQAYKETFDADGVMYHLGEWNSSDGDTYTSIIVQVPSRQMILELVQQTSLNYSALEEQPHYLEQRVPMQALRRYEVTKATASNKLAERANANSVGSILTPLVVSRAASATSISKLEDFYVTGMGTSKTHDSTDGEVVKKCFLWSGATVEICFTQRPDNATAGDWKVVDFEDMLNTVHSNIVEGYPFCGMDKWEDNHYAIDGMTMDTSVTSGIISYINKEHPYHYCSVAGTSTALHYVWDPTGWGIQLDLQFADVPDDCKSASESSTRQQSNFLSQKSSDIITTGGTWNPVCEVDLTVCPDGETITTTTSEARPLVASLPCIWALVYVLGFIIEIQLAR